MKGYRNFILVFIAVLALYVLAEINRPKPIDWRVTLSREDKNPYGSYILYHQLKDLFPSADLEPYRLPVYNQINNFSDSNTAYFLIDPNLELSKEDVDELLNYVVVGNYVFISSSDLGKRLGDSLHIQTERRLTIKNKDSIWLNFVNPLLHDKNGYVFNPFTIDQYVKDLDTTNTIVLGKNQFGDVNFIKIPYGNGAFIFNANPICFSNYFMLARNNAEYTSTALSFVPGNVKKIFWDEYYKLGPEGTKNPLRFILLDPYLKWAYRLGLVSLLVYVFFEMKRRQRIIPSIPPLRNNTLDFVETIGGLYFNTHNNNNIAQKKVQHLLEFIRSHFYIPTGQLDDNFELVLVKKSGVSSEEIKYLLDMVRYVSNQGPVSDSYLLELNSKVDLFYKKAK